MYTRKETENWLINVPDAENSDWLLTEEKGLLILDLEFIVFPLTVNTVVLEHVGHVLSSDEGVVDSDELNIVPLENNSSNQTTNSSESVDSDPNLLVSYIKQQTKSEKRSDQKTQQRKIAATGREISKSERLTHCRIENES
jgi:hypothetical protein